MFAAMAKSFGVVVGACLGLVAVGVAGGWVAEKAGLLDDVDFDYVEVEVKKKEPRAVA